MAVTALQEIAAVLGRGIGGAVAISTTTTSTTTTTTVSGVPSNFSPHTIRSIIIALMKEFSGIKVRTYDPPGSSNVVKEQLVPIQFGPMEKYYVKKKVGDDSSGQYYQTMPKLAINWTGLSFNGERYKGRNQIRTFYDENLQLSDINKFIKDVSPVPYDMTFELQIRTRSLTHFSQIMENVLPFFDPSRYLRVREFSFLNIERNLKVNLDGISQDFLNEQDEESRRYVYGSLQMTVEMFMYKPLANEGIIKEIQSRYYGGAQSDGPSAVAGYDTSAWSSSATFTTGYDFSSTSNDVNNDEFEVYIDSVIDF